MQQDKPTLSPEDQKALCADLLLYGSSFTQTTYNDEGEPIGVRRVPHAEVYPHIPARTDSHGQ